MYQASASESPAAVAGIVLIVLAIFAAALATVATQTLAQNRGSDQSVAPVADSENLHRSGEEIPTAAVPTNDVQLPVIVVAAPKGAKKLKPKPNPKPPQIAQRTTAPTPAQVALDAKMQGLDRARENLLPKIGASTYTIDHQSIDAMPQGDNTPIDKVVLQMPAVSYDSAISNPSFHVRSEYANVQYRINGVVLPEGVSGLGPVIDTNFVGSLSLLTGTLPAQYGLRTAGVLDITSRSFATPGGEVSLYGGSHDTFTPSFDYGGSVGNTEYFLTARGNWNSLGLENPTPSVNAFHDQTEQGKFFGYASTLLDDSTRLSVISAASHSVFQIPDIPNQVPLGNFGPANYNSLLLNENEYDTYIANIVSWQKQGTDGDAQFAVYSRYAKINFVPDVYGDLVFNDVASNVTRESVLNGAQFDTSYVVNEQHVVRGGFAISAEQTHVSDLATVLPVNPLTGAISPTPFTIDDATAKLGWNIGGYVQDEWKITDKLTLNAGLRFDQLYQWVDANQLSPRLALVYRPVLGTTVHAGFARYFTPPYQAQATQSNIALFTNTTNQPEVPLNDPVKPERASYYDVGIDQTVFPGLVVGVDAYYKDARDLLDDGQFGQAVVLTQLNFARGYSEGGEFKLKYQNGDLKAYANLSYNITRAIDLESSQYLVDAATYNYLLTNWHYTDDMQLVTGSAGASYRWNGALLSADLIYGSGLRSGFANTDHVPPYTVVNLGLAREFQWPAEVKPVTLRFDVVNLFDQIYELRTGTGIGVFAPQYGARRGFYAGISQKL